MELKEFVSDKILNRQKNVTDHHHLNKQIARELHKSLYNYKEFDDPSGQDMGDFQEMIYRAYPNYLSLAGLPPNTPYLELSKQEQTKAISELLSGLLPFEEDSDSLNDFKDKMLDSINTTMSTQFRENQIPNAGRTQLTGEQWVRKK